MEWTALATIAGSTFVGAMIPVEPSHICQRIAKVSTNVVRQVGWILVWITLPPSHRLVEFDGTRTIREVAKGAHKAKGRHE
ncbi:hypothetical protein [Actinokineospora enzanensis]|uniref:hypothetical protein n=1 Tax=Actinokineospora enzanensis TaxID=155975 RepID=UPI0012EBC1A5|nr:hypothetical protein [Actinokineospora enzanensis]